MNSPQTPTTIIPKPASAPAAAPQSTAESAPAGRIDVESGGVSFWQLFLRRKWMIVLCVATGLGLGYLYFNRQPPVYESHARIYVYQDKTRLPIEDMRFSDRRLDLQNTHIQIIKSPMIIEQAVRDQGLGELPSLKSAEDPVPAIIGNLFAEGILETDIIHLSYRCRYPDDCKRILDAICASYSKFLDDSKKSEKSDFENLITRAMGALKSEIDENTEKLTKHRVENQLTLKGEVPYNPHQINMEAIDERRVGLQIQQTEIRGQIDSIKRLQASGASRSVLMQTLEGFTKSSEPRFRSREAAEPELVPADQQNKPADLVELYVRLELLKKRLGPQHRMIQQLESEIKVREDLYESNLRRDAESPDKAKPDGEDFVERYLSALEHQAETIDAMIAALNKEYDAELKKSYQLDNLIDEDQKLRFQIEKSQTLVDILSQKLSEINLIENEGGLQASLIAPPNPGTQVAINFNQIMSLAGGLGLMVGLLIGYLFEMSDTSFRGPEDIAEQLGVPVLGHIPAMMLDNIVVDPAVGLDASLCAFYEPKSRTSEGYRAIRTALYFSTRGEGHKVVQVTSPDPGDGKSTLAANLAISIANSGKRALLVDADFRRPRVHKLFGLDDAKGVTSVIAGKSEIPDAIQDTAVDNLWALVCGPRPSNPSELLTSPRFEELLNIVREKFEFVIVDTPPMLAVTDPSAVAARVDGVFVAMRLTPKARAKATQAVKMLTSFDANILGVVVNGVGNRHDHTYGTSYTYGGDYQYVYGDDEDDDPYCFYYDEDEEEGDTAPSPAIEPTLETVREDAG